MAGDMRSIVESAGGCSLLRHRVLASLFFEPSTRTSCSFAAAMSRLGGSVLAVAESTSSAAKGESLADTVRSLACYADAVVLRHPAVGAAAEAAAAIAVPLLNAGDGVGEHPTQALLDLYTIAAERGALAQLHVVLVGDLRNGRTVHSLSKLLARWPGSRFTLVAPGEAARRRAGNEEASWRRTRGRKPPSASAPPPPPPLPPFPSRACAAELALPADIVASLRASGCAVAESEALTAEILGAADVLYVTRVQKERFSSAEAYERLKHAYVISRETMAALAPRAIVMHPLPRVGEIREEVDADPRAVYFRQMRYGLFVRMALLALVMGVSPAAVRAEAEAARAAAG